MIAAFHCVVCNIACLEWNQMPQENPLFVQWGKPSQGLSVINCMILKGRRRASGGLLATSLLDCKKERVCIVDIRGSNVEQKSTKNVRQFLKDLDDVGQVAHIRNSLFHLVLSVYDGDSMTRADWEYSVAKVERAFGLEGQPRVVVSHLYKGKEHWHAVWSRVDAKTGQCLERGFRDLKLTQIAREIEIELGLQRRSRRVQCIPTDSQPGVSVVHA
ncbi:MAG: hypothetical protein EOP06_11770 [Proteobacteria bacterium]|nr:MAG: hypothetical protein EOP06_11770 [Pseudomonadota bacterium]